MITPEERAEWNRRTSPDIQPENGVKDALWRLAWLYTYQPKTGATLPFRPNEEQIEIIIAIHLRGWKRILVPKARQLGMSTILCLIGLDMALFREGFKYALVDKTWPDAETKMLEKIRGPWAALPPAIQAGYEHPAGYDRTERIGFKVQGFDDDTISCCEGGVSFRGGTAQLLHISEWGWIQAQDPARSQEILTGSLPAAEEGIIVVETTWEGGKGGDLWPFVEEALAAESKPESEKGPKTWRLLFFGWWTCKDYATPHGHEDDDSKRLLDGHAQRLGLTFTSEQRNWYAEKRRTLKRKVFKEFPTTLEECWHSPVAGAIYGEEMDRLRAAGRVGREFSLMREFPLFTFSDLGMSDTTVVVACQFVGTDLHILDYAEWEGQPASYYADHVRKWETDFGKLFMKHFLPHDAARRGLNDATSYQDTLAKLGVPNTEIIPQSHDIWWGINLFRDLLPRCIFHSRCQRTWKDAQDRERLSLVQALEAYRKRIEPGAGGAIITERPVHDHASHCADAMRYIAEARFRGMIPTMEKVSRPAEAFDPFRTPGRRKARMNVGG